MTNFTPDQVETIAIKAASIKGRSTRYHRASGSETLLAAAALSAKDGKPRFIYATCGGYQIEPVMPVVPPGNRVTIVTGIGYETTVV